MTLTCAAYYVAFGPHGPRKPINPPGTSIKVAFGVATLIGLSGATYFAVRASGAFFFLAAFQLHSPIRMSHSFSSPFSLLAVGIMCTAFASRVGRIPLRHTFIQVLANVGASSFAAVSALNLHTPFVMFAKRPHPAI